jgi:hypothetical protein
MLHYYGVTLHALLLHTSTFVYFFIYNMFTYYPIRFIFWLLIALSFIQYCIVSEWFKFVVVFYNKFKHCLFKLYVGIVKRDLVSPFLMYSPHCSV